MKGPGPSIKEDTWKAVKVSGKGPKDFGSRRTGPLISQREISAFREPGIRKTENRGNACIAVSRIAKAGSGRAEP
jgi:hypothetical protein